MQAEQIRNTDAASADIMLELFPTFGITTQRMTETLLSLGGDLSRPFPVSTTHFVWGTLNPALHASVPTERLYVIRQGDTLTRTLVDAGLSVAQATEAATALRNTLPAQELKPGLEIALTIDPLDENTPLRRIRVELDQRTTVMLQRNADGELQASRITRPVVRSLVRIDGVVGTSTLYEEMANAGVPSRQILVLIRILGYMIDLQHDIQPGDTFRLISERLRGPNGEVLQQGNVVQAEFHLSGLDIVLWRYTGTNDAVEWVDDTGRPLRSALLRTPMDGTLITTSGFGLRQHPILNYTSAHRGIDFSAPTGTPVFAAANGTVTFAGQRNGYGNTIEISHDEETKTRYAHLSRIAPEVRTGTVVRQGQVIGNVGSTGLSTGPHLHYELHINNRAVDPRRQVAPLAPALSRADFARFQRYRGDMLRILTSFQGPGEIAAAE